MKIVLIALLLIPSLGIACSDPVKHREHLLREMQAAEAERTQGAPFVNNSRGTETPPPNNLDSSDQFFGTVGRGANTDETPRRRSR